MEEAKPFRIAKQAVKIAFERVKVNKGTLGIPTVEDRIAQMVAKIYLEPNVEKIFYEDSYGYRPNKSAIQAIGVVREMLEKRLGS